MLKKLRIEFVVTIMTIVAAVLLVVFSTICIIDYQQAVTDVYATLNSAIDRNTMEKKEPLPIPAPPDNAPREEEASASGEGSETEETPKGKPFEIGGKADSKRFIPVAVYAIENDGSFAAVSDATTASISDEVLAQAADRTNSFKNGSGLIDSLGLYYVKRTSETGSFIAFADQSSAQGWQTLALTLAGVGAIALLAFLAISLLFSKWALKPVEASWRAQQQFVADASHELKTPLTVMLANTSILLKHPEKTVASQSQWVEGIETEARSMQQLVGDMLLLATPEKAESAQTRSPIDISDIMERNLLQFESLAFEYGIEVESNIEKDICIQGNAVRFERLVSTLLDNAYKYAGDHGRIEVSLSRNRHGIELSVANSGDTIPPEDLPHIFDRFYRVDKARERSVGGHGLGLAIAREVAEEHGGTIAARSSKAEGTVFTVRWNALASAPSSNR